MDERGSATAGGDRRLLLGRDHERLGEAAVEVLADGAAACALSAGASEAVLRRKGGGATNEDGVLVVETGTHALLAVADGHHGCAAAEALLERTAERWRGWPATRTELLAFLDALLVPAVGCDPACATTWLACEVDRVEGVVRGISYGDSSPWLLAPGARPVRLAAANRHYVAPGRGPPPSALGVEPFLARLPRGGVVVAFTDGVNECCYGRPERSIDARRLQDLFERHADDVGGFVAALVRRALRGVGGHPGGEDNVAIACARAARGPTAP